MQKRVIKVPSSIAFGWVGGLAVTLLPVPFALYFIAMRYRHAEPVDWGMIALFVIPPALPGLWVVRRSTLGRFEIQGEEIRFAAPGVFGTTGENVTRGALDSLRFRFVKNFGCHEATEVVAVLKDGTSQVLWRGSDLPAANKLPRVVNALSEAAAVPVRAVVFDDGYPSRPESEWRPPAPRARLATAAGLLLGVLPWIAGFLAPFVTHEPATIALVGALVLGCSLFALRSIVGALRTPGKEQESLGVHLGFWMFLAPLYYAVAALVSYSTFVQK